MSNLYGDIPRRPVEIGRPDTSTRTDGRPLGGRTTHTPGASHQARVRFDTNGGERLIDLAGVYCR